MNPTDRILSQILQSYVNFENRTSLRPSTFKVAGIMEHVSGVEIGDALDDLQFPQKQRLALEAIIDLYNQLFKLLEGGRLWQYLSYHQLGE